MKGKKIDVEFVSQFMSDCIGRNVFTSESILQEALNEISSIDEIIKKTELLKKRRSKLLDVVSKFDFSTTYIKTVTVNDRKILSLYKIRNHNIGKFICVLFFEQNIININYVIDHSSNFFSKSDIMFCIKQLSENEVLNQQDQLLSKGQKFNDYYEYILQDL